MTDGRGIPLAVAVEGANCHDKKMVEQTLQSLACERPTPTRFRPQHMCMDKGYDYPDTRAWVQGQGYIVHIKARGEEVRRTFAIPRYRARRWVVERTHSWLNRFRRLLIRWEKKAANYLAMLHLAFAMIAFRTVFG
jgi:transposase